MTRRLSITFFLTALAILSPLSFVAAVLVTFAVGLKVALDAELMRS